MAIIVNSISRYNEYFIYSHYGIYPFHYHIIEDNGKVLENSIEWGNEYPVNLEEVEEEIHEFMQEFDYEGKTETD